MSNSSIRPLDKTLTGAITPSDWGPGRGGNEKVLCISQNYCITEASPSYCLVSYPEHSLGGGVQQFRRDIVDVFFSPSRLGSTARWSRKMFIYSLCILFLLLKKKKRKKKVLKLKWRNKKKYIILTLWEFDQRRKGEEKYLIPVLLSTGARKERS